MMTRESTYCHHGAWGESEESGFLFFFFFFLSLILTTIL